MQITSAYNITALRLRNRLAEANDDVATSMERLATGKRVNRAADDPSAIQVLPPMKGQIESIKASIKSIDEEGFYHSAREGALSVLSDSLLELRSIVTTAANKSGLSQDELDALQGEATSILQGIDFLANTATFRGQQILAGYSAKGLGLDDLFKGADLETADLEAADRAVNAAVNNVAGSRSAIGRAVRENESRRDTLLSELENLTGVVSSIEDTDYAKETAELVRAQLMQQVTTYLSSINADTHRETVLKLISATTAVKA